MITPSIPKWLPQNLWKGMVFEDIVACARRWMPTLRDKEKADVIVGLFHSGIGSSDQTGSGNENAALQVAREVPGFDIIFCGHDHRASKNIVKNSENKEVLVINPGSNGKNVAQADITLSRKVEKRISGEIVSLANINHGFNKKLNKTTAQRSLVCPLRCYDSSDWYLIRSSGLQSKT